jgi:hypothetical protein
MDEVEGDLAAEAAAPVDLESKVYTQSEWDLEHQKWLCRVWSLSAWPFGILIFSWLFGETKPIELLSIGLGGLAVLWAPAAYHWYRYSKATGNWFWL